MKGDRPDPKQDIYRFLDEAGLGITKFSQAKPMSRIISDIRQAIAAKLAPYITERETAAFAAGVQKGKMDAEEKKRKTIEVQDGES